MNTFRLNKSGLVYKVTSVDRSTGEYGLVYKGAMVDGCFEAFTEQTNTIYKNIKEVDKWQPVQMEGVHNVQVDAGTLLQFHTRVNYSSHTARQMFRDDWMCIKREQQSTAQYLKFVYHGQMRLGEVLSSNDTNVQMQLVVDKDAVYGLNSEVYKQFAMDKMAEVEWLSLVDA